MVVSFKKPLLIFLFVGIFLSSVLISPAEAATEYYRQQNIRYGTQKSNSPNRFNYANPYYRARQTSTQPECRSHGQAICLGPKKPKGPQFRFYNRMYQKKIHPYLRKLHRYQKKYQYYQIR